MARGYRNIRCFECGAVGSEMAIEAERRRREEKARLEAERRRWRIEEAHRAYSEAVKSSRAELVAIIEGWALAKRVEQFFDDLSRRTDPLSVEQRTALAARAAKARKLIGGSDTLQRLRDWKTPTERLRPEIVAVLDADATAGDQSPRGLDAWGGEGTAEA